VQLLISPLLHQGKSQRNRIGATLLQLGFERMTRKIGGKAKKIWGRELFTIKSNPTSQCNPTLKDGLPLETLMAQQENLSNLSNLSFKTLDLKEIKVVDIDTQVEETDHLLINTAPMTKDGFFKKDGLHTPSNPDSVSDTKCNLTQKDGLHLKDGLHYKDGDDSQGFEYQ
jgi:hypothetical protein